MLAWRGAAKQLDLPSAVPKVTVGTPWRTIQFRIEFAIAGADGRDAADIGITATARLTAGRVSFIRNGWYSVSSLNLLRHRTWTITTCAQREDKTDMIGGTS